MEQVNNKKTKKTWKDILAWIFVILSLLLSLIGVVIGIIFSANEIFNGKAKIGIPTLELSATLFIATIISLAIIFLLSRFLFWNKIKDHLDSRRTNIITNIAAADFKNREAEKFLNTASNKVKESKELSREIIDEGKQEALKQKQEGKDEAKRESEAIIMRAREQIEIEKNLMKKEIQKEILETSILAAEKIIEKEINKDINEKMIDELINNLE